MVTVGAGRAEALLEEIQDIEYVSEANVVAGEYDIIVEAEADEVYDIINSVVTKVRSLEGIHDTKTYICLE
jgi:DNA-binding Lrp family transcriptional regulator